jgi:hypothetical protein
LNANRTSLPAQRALLPVQLGTVIMFHPADGFRQLRGRAGWKTACLLILLTIVVRIVTIYMTSFHITGLQPQYANIALEIGRFVLPVISGAIVCYLVTAIMDGEAFFGEVATAVSYSMLPYIIFSIPVAALSNILSRDELGLYIGLNNVIWVWVAILIFIQLHVMNDYTFAKSVGVGLLSLGDDRTCFRIDESRHEIRE